MLIRPLHATDIPALATLMATTPLWQRYGVTTASATQRLQNGLAEGATIAVAEQNGQPTGFVWYVTRGAFQRGGYIMLLGVASAFRKQGIGQALMAYAEAQMFSHVNAVFLLVSDFNHAANTFTPSLAINRSAPFQSLLSLGLRSSFFINTKLLIQVRPTGLESPLRCSHTGLHRS